LDGVCPGYLLGNILLKGGMRMSCNFKYLLPKSEVVRCQLKIENIQVDECDGEENCILHKKLEK
jgi:hypothetical protein